MYILYIINEFSNSIFFRKKKKYEKNYYFLQRKYSIEYFHNILLIFFL